MTSIRIAAVVVGCLFVAACRPAGDTAPGERLARVHCGGCHLFPEPDLLDRATWTERVLPDMAARLGVYTTLSRDSILALNRVDEVDLDSVYPPDPVVSPDDLAAVASYYAAHAPDVLSPPERPPIAVGLSGFTVRSSENRFDPPLTTLARIDTVRSIFFLGNYGSTSMLLVVDAYGRPLERFDLEGAPIAARIFGRSVMTLLVGPGPAPTDAARGALVMLDHPSAPPRPLITDLQRPVDLDFGDLNGDDLTDLVISEYGHYTGRLAWYETAPDGSTRRHVLSDRPGAVQAALHDFNGDGLLDILALMAQGDEGFDLYTNTGEGTFMSERILRFPPVYGSTFFELVDFNGDERLDILYVNGDNADVTPVPKPYHGVRILLAEDSAGGGVAFREHRFVPIHGAVSARAADFDLDGDLDIAAISYFPDYAQSPEESFVLLRNDGNFDFTPFTFEDAARGRWLRMDVGDLDGDDDPDILLGSNIGFGPQGDRTGLYERWEREAPSYLVLENTAN